MSVPIGHGNLDADFRPKDTHAEAEAAKAAHVRPQDRNKPDTSGLPIGAEVVFETHAGRAFGVVEKDLGPASDLLGMSLHTREGRGDKSAEHQFVVIDESSGDAHTLARSAIRLRSEEDSSAGFATSQVHPSGAVDAAMNTDRKGPRRK